MPSTTHWPLSSGKECWCGDKFLNTAAFREHLRIWVAGLQRIEFKRHESHWTSSTVTPMHVFIAQADAVNPHQYQMDCQCGWMVRARLPLVGAKGDENSPGRLAVAHIRDVVAERLRLEEALDE